MQRVNFIWIGALPEDYRIVLSGPFSLCENLRLRAEVDIFFWCLEEYKEVFKAIFAPYHIQVFSTDDLRRSVRARMIPFDPSPTDIEGVGQLYTYMDHFKCVELCILATGQFNLIKELTASLLTATMGGYFFDCSVKFSEKSRLPPYPGIRVSTRDTKIGALDHSLSKADLENTLTMERKRSSGVFMSPIRDLNYSYINEEQQIDAIIQRLIALYNWQVKSCAGPFHDHPYSQNTPFYFPIARFKQEHVKGRPVPVLPTLANLKSQRALFSKTHDYCDFKTQPRLFEFLVPEVWTYYCPPNDGYSMRIFAVTFKCLMHRLCAVLASENPERRMRSIQEDPKPLFEKHTLLGSAILDSLGEALFFAMPYSNIPLFAFDYVLVSSNENPTSTDKVLYCAELHVEKFSGRKRSGPDWQHIPATSLSPIGDNFAKIRGFLEQIHPIFGEMHERRSAENVAEGINAYTQSLGRAMNRQGELSSF